MKQIYTGYQWRPMTGPELEIMDQDAVRAKRPDEPVAGDIVEDDELEAFREAWAEFVVASGEVFGVDRFLNWISKCVKDDAQAGDIYIAQQEADKQDDNKAFIRYYSPAPSGPDWADDGLEAYCGNCDEDLMDGFESWSYCPHCGKELWSDDGDGHEEKGWL